LLPHLHEHDTGACLDLLTVADPADETVLAVSFDESPRDKARRWDDNLDTPPDELAVVAVGDSPAEAAPESSSGEEESSTPTVIHTIADRGDLVSLGEAISRQLSEWEHGDDRTVVCFQSLTALLEHIELRQLFRFLHALCYRLKSAGAVSHFHLDPDAVDERTIYTLRPLFDTIVEHDASGAVQISDAASR
jgi:hypothetical protein